MRWIGQRQSGNVEDRRRMGPLVAGGGIGSIILALVVYFISGNPNALMMTSSPGTDNRADQDELKQFVSVVLADTEDVWHEQFRQMGREYREPKLVLFSGQVQSACGRATASVGPFYCPEDQRVYIDLNFYQQLRQRLGAPGDFAQAYVIAHEVGHHVQNLLGISQRVQAMEAPASETERNQLSMRLELQADFLAGVWAHHAQRMKGIMESGDLEEAIRAAAAVGDDKLQKQSQGYVVPDSFTHGTSEQRVRWFRKGFQTGDIRQGDTFGAGRL